MQSTAVVITIHLGIEGTGNTHLQQTPQCTAIAVPRRRDLSSSCLRCVYVSEDGDDKPKQSGPRSSTAGETVLLASSSTLVGTLIAMPLRWLSPCEDATDNINTERSLDEMPVQLDGRKSCALSCYGRGSESGRRSRRC